MALGRNLHAPNGLAVSVLSLDGEIDAQLISDFKAVPGVETAVAVKLPGYGEYPSWMN